MTTARVVLWGTEIGAVTLDPDASAAAFRYTSEFRRSGIEVAPIAMPLSDRVYQFRALPYDAFRGLPGLLADSLPDRFGTAVLNAWLASNGRPKESFDPVERLLYTGRRGMGALEFEPAERTDLRESVEVDVEALVRLASRILDDRQTWQTELTPDDPAHAIRDMLRVGTSAGGARAKAVIGWNEDTGEVRSGQIDLPPGFQHWLLKFDGVRSNRDRELADPLGFGTLEYVYSRMAKDAGIEMAECRLLDDGPRGHFMTRRFDRTDRGDKVHMQTLGAMAHADYNATGATSYEDAFDVARRIDVPAADVRQLFRRAVFNVVARNQDDHVKNIAFLMGRDGAWSLSPAYDLTWAHNPSGDWTSRHQMSLNGKRDGFTREDIRSLGDAARLPRGRALSVLDEVLEVVARFDGYALEEGVDAQLAATVRAELRLDW